MILQLFELNEWLPAFLLILTRISSFMITIPIFSYRTIPAQFKVGLSIFLSWIILFSGDWPLLTIDYSYFLLILKEALVGLTVGLIAMILMYSVQVAGGFIDYKMGFMIANVIDPQTGAQSPLTGSYIYTFAMLLLLATDSHHLLLDGIFFSYHFIPMDQAFLPFSNIAVLDHAVSTFSFMFLIAFQMAMPIIGSIFLVDVALGMVSRAVPQINVFVVGMPLKILVGFVIMFLMFTPFFMVVDYLIERMILAMRTLMQLYGGA